MPFSQAQLNAINIRNKNVIVSASAGSGKTSVLVERLSTLVIKDRIPINTILAMTFTNDAASEMKARLKKDLQKKKEENPSDDYIANQLTLLETSSICTIDSFCQSLVKNYYYKIPISLTMATNVGSESDLMHAFSMAYNQAVQQLDSKSYTQLKLYFKALGKQEEDIKKVIETLINVGKSKPNMNEWFNEILSHYDSLDIQSETWFFQFFKEIIQAMLDILDKSISEVEAMEVKSETTRNKKLDSFHIKKEDLSICLEELVKKDYVSFKKAFIRYIEHSDKFPGTYNGYTFDKNYLSFQEEIQKNLFDLDTFEMDIKDNKTIANSLIQLCIHTDSYFAQIKKEKEIIDFSDMEHFALQLLEDKVIQEELRNKYNEILIDEFQDTNELQETIVSKFCRDNNVFRVGDIKQSIYGFRQANPSIMKNHMNSTSFYDCSLVLEENYRSNKSIIDFNNDFYQKIMNTDLLGSQFDDIDIAKVGTDQQVDSLEHPIRFIYCSSEQIKNDYQVNGTQANKICENNRYHFIAQSILEDIKKGKQFKDICILLRSRTHLEDIKNCLESYNIPVFGQVTNGFYTNNAIQIVCATLNALINPYDDIQLMACLCSPLFNVSYQEISAACVHNEKNQSLFETIRSYPFMNDFLDFKKNKEHTVASLIRSIYEFNDFYVSHTTSQDKTNLDYLLEKASNYLYPYDIEGFIEMIENESQLDRTGQANAFGKEENVVRIMTMHASKGLQFPICYILSDHKMKSQKDAVMIDANLGFALSHVDYKNQTRRPSYYNIAFQSKAIHDSLMEEMRILYVATTRAKEEIVFVDYVSNEEEYNFPLNTNALLNMKSYTSWLFHTYRNDDRIQFINRNIIIEDKENDICNQVVNRKYYQKEDEVLRSFSASQAKAKLVWPSFDVNEGAMDRGTLFHEMAGNCSYPYQLEDVLEYGKAHNYVFSQKDLDQFMSLNNCVEYAQWMKLPHQFELSYIVQELEQVVHGYMDFVVFDDEITILDFKTDSLSEESLVSSYQNQLITYKKSLQKVYPNKKINMVLYSFYHRKLINIVE